MTAIHGEAMSKKGGDKIGGARGSTSTKKKFQKKNQSDSTLRK